MNTKPLYVVAAAMLCFCMAGAAFADSIYANPRSGPLGNGYALPVLVEVNQHGKVTSASPAYKLKPRFQHFLRTTLDEMIDGPAHDKHGHAVASQFVIYLTAKTTPRANGGYNLRLAYVKAVPVPPGPLHWAHINDGHKLALVGPQDFTFPPNFGVPGQFLHPVFAPPPPPPTAPPSGKR